MKTEIHPTYRDAHVRCTCGNEFTTRSVERRDPRRDLLELPSLLHGPSEARRHRWSRRALPAPRGETQGRRRRLAAELGPCAAFGGSGRERRRQASRGRRPTRPAGQLRAARDAPVGGQAVLEGVMMRGIRTWAVAVRKPSDEQLATHREGLDPEEAAARRDRGRRRAARVVAQTPPRPAPADHPRRRRARRVAQDRLQSARHLRQRPAAGGGGGDLRRHVGRHDRRLDPARRRAVLPDPRRRHVADQGPARLVVPLLARRGPAAHGDLPRLPAGALAPARPAARVRVPRRRAQDDLLLRGRAWSSRRRTPSASRACIRAAGRRSCCS